MAFVSITRLRIRSWRFLPGFLIYTWRSWLQARRAPGILSASLKNDAHSVFWTRTVWQDEAAMRSFLRVGAHGQVMPRLLDWCDEAALVHWTQDSAERPSWPEAFQRLVKEGRRSKVRHPSPAQERFDIPPPRA